MFKTHLPVFVFQPVIFLAQLIRASTENARF